MYIVACVPALYYAGWKSLTFDIHALNDQDALKRVNEIADFVINTPEGESKLAPMVLVYVARTNEKITDCRHIKRWRYPPKSKEINND